MSVILDKDITWVITQLENEHGKEVSPLLMNLLLAISARLKEKSCE